MKFLRELLFGCPSGLQSMAQKELEIKMAVQEKLANIMQPEVEALLEKSIEPDQLKGVAGIISMRIARERAEEIKTEIYFVPMQNGYEIKLTIPKNIMES